MKKIAAFLLSIFMLFQAGPAIASIFSPTINILVIDEEKSEDKEETGKKEQKKEFPDYSGYNAEFTSRLMAAFHHIEKMPVFPWLEKLSPPPNR